MAIALSSSLTRMSSSVRPTLSGRRMVSPSLEAIKNIQGTFIKKGKVRREILEKQNVLKNRRLEKERRKRQEDELEAPNVVARPDGPFEVTQKSNKGFLERILGFLGYLSAGWLLNNLPTLIAMGKEFVGRVQRMGQLIGGFVTNITNIFTGFGNLLSASFQNLVQFDLFDTSNRVKDAFGQLTGSVDDMGRELEEALKLITTPLTEGMVTGEDAPPTGQERTSEGAYEPGAPLQTGGGTYSESSLISAMDKGGITDKTERAMFLAQMRHESGNFKYDEEIASGKDYEGRKDLGNVNPGDGVRYKGRGYIQLTGRANYRTYGKKIGVDLENNPELAKRPDIAAAIALAYWNSRVNKNAARSGDVKTVTYNINGGYNGLSARQKYFDDYVKKGVPTAQTSSIQQQSQIRQVPVGNINPTIGDRLGAGRGHGGVDLQVKNGTPLRAVSDGVIVDSDYEKGWGNFLVMKDDRGIYHLYGHMQPGYKRSGSVKKGEVIGKVGMTGRTTGPHLHWETGTGWNGGRITGRFDALSKYSKYAPFNTSLDPGVSVEAPTPSPAQIASIRNQQQTQQRNQQLSQDRTGPTVIVQEPSEPESQAPSYSGGGAPGMMPLEIDEFTLVNRFIKNKLLLDLAYL
jgi:predicted chitinase